MHLLGIQFDSLWDLGIRALDHYFPGPALRIDLEEGGGLLDDLADVGYPGVQIQRPGVAQQARYYAVETGNALGDLADQPPVRVPGFEVSFQQVGEAGNAPQGVADLVGHGRRHLAEGGQGVHALNLRFQALHLGEVVEGLEGAQNLAMVIPDQG